MKERMRRITRCHEQVRVRLYPQLRNNLHVDFNGRPMPFYLWAWRFEQRRFRVVKKTEVGDCHVSAIWLGLTDLLGGDSENYEVMSFGSDNKSVKQDRCRTREEAIAIHDSYVAEWNLARSVCGS